MVNAMGSCMVSKVKVWRFSRLRQVGSLDTEPTKGASSIHWKPINRRIYTERGGRREAEEMQKGGVKGVNSRGRWRVPVVREEDHYTVGM